MFILKASFLALFLLCIASAADAADSLPESITLKGNYDTTWKEAVLMFADKGWTVPEKDKDVGLMVTDWKVFSIQSLFTRGWRAKINLTFKKVDDTSTEITPKISYEYTVTPLALGARPSDSSWVPTGDNAKYTQDIKGKLYKVMQERVEKQ